MKTGDFDSFVLSVFDVGDIKVVMDAIENVWKEELEEGNMEVTRNSFNMSDYYVPEHGFIWLPKFSCWKSRHYSDKVFFASDSMDGMQPTCLNVREKIHCNLLMCTFSNDGEQEPKYGIRYIKSDGGERSVLAMKEDRWTFSESGEPLPIEDLSLYKNKYVRKRINNGIIAMYLKRMGITLDNIDDGVVASATYKLLEWKTDKNKALVERVQCWLDMAGKYSYEILQIACRNSENIAIKMKKK